MDEKELRWLLSQIEQTENVYALRRTAMVLGDVAIKQHAMLIKTRDELGKLIVMLKELQAEKLPGSQSQRREPTEPRRANTGFWKEYKEPPVPGDEWKQ